MKLEVRTGDILVYSGGSFIAKSIKWFERGYREEPSIASHAGIFSGDGVLGEAHIFIIEALPPKVVKRDFLTAYRNDLKNCYFLQPIGIHRSTRMKIVNEASKLVGLPYGMTKIFANAVDGLFAKLLKKKNFYGIRRFFRLPAFPICSYLVAHAYKKAGLDFGMKDYYATPDDILDFAFSHPEKYRVLTLDKTYDLYEFKMIGGIENDEKDKSQNNQSDKF